MPRSPLRALLARSAAPTTPVPLRLTPELRRALLLAIVFAVVWWLAALWLRGLEQVPIWYDQEVTFTLAGRHLADPFVLPGFVCPPWAAILLVPFSLPPLPIAVLLQTILQFALLVLVLFRFGGGLTACLLALSAYIAFQSTTEQNIDYLIYLGLLVPPTLSGVFLAIKPQIAFGYWLGLPPRQVVIATLVVGGLCLVSFAIWDFWPTTIWERVQVLSLPRAYNLAPLRLLPWPLSIALGLAGAYWAVRRRDAVLGVAAGLFFVPYLPAYSLLLHYGLLAVRYPRLALLISVVMWIIYGGVLAAGLLLALR
jgi:hypothetical protein